LSFSNQPSGSVGWASSAIRASRSSGERTPKRPADAVVGGQQVGHEGKVVSLDVAEQEGRAAPLRHPRRDLGGLQARADLGLDADKLSRLAELFEKVGQA
jgi:hypothetical protein